MNADPTSKTVQRLYGLAQEEFARRDEVKDYLERSVEAHAAGRAEESLEWARKAYDRYPNDMAYAVLEKARRNAEQAREKAKTPKDAGTPVLPMVLLGGTGLAAYGGYRVLKSRGAKESEEGVNPEPEVSPEQARANYMKSAAVAGTLLVALAAWEFGPGALAAARAIFATAGPTSPGLTPAYAGAGPASGGAVLVDQALVSGGVKAAGTTAVLIGGKAVHDNISYVTSQQSATGQNQPQGPSSSVKRPGPVKDRKLRNIIDALFKPGDGTPGGTAGAVRNEIMTGQWTRGRWHLTKAREAVSALDDVLANKGLDPMDRATAQALRDDLLNALNNTQPGNIVP